MGPSLPAPEGGSRFQGGQVTLEHSWEAGPSWDSFPVPVRASGKAWKTGTLNGPSLAPVS